MSKHLLIAGTGRAGTSFLVRYLTRLGLETRLSRAGAAAGWHEHANAGLEDMPLPDPGDLPYVIKSPWTYQYIQELLASPTLELDAVIIPIRDLTEAAASRSIIELQQMHSSLPWMAEQARTWEDFAHTPGGIVFSTSPIDQARLLAVGFHHLLDKLVKADIPVVMLSFPRFIEDANYLHRKLAPVLPQTISPDLARVAHREIADPHQVRVGREVMATSSASHAGSTLAGLSHEQLDQVSLRRVLKTVRRDLADAQAQLTNASQTIRIIQDERDRASGDLQKTQQELTAMSQERDTALAKASENLKAADSTARALTSERECHVADTQAAERTLRAITEERDQARQTARDLRTTMTRLRQQLDCVEGATTWRAAVLLQRLAKRVPGAIPLGSWLFRTNSLRP